MLINMTAIICLCQRKGGKWETQKNDKISSGRPIFDEKLYIAYMLDIYLLLGNSRQGVPSQ